MATKLRIRKEPDPPLTERQKAGENIGNAIVNKTPLYDIADSRDIVSMLVGGGHKALNNDELQLHFGRLQKAVGAPLAQKLASQAILFNQRPDAQKLTPEQRVESFYNLGSNDSDVSGYLHKARTFGQGQAQGFANSTLFGNSVVQQKVFTTPTVVPPVAESGKRIKLVVRNK